MYVVCYNIPHPLKVEDQELDDDWLLSLLLLLFACVQICVIAFHIRIMNVWLIRPLDIPIMNMQVPC